MNSRKGNKKWHWVFWGIYFSFNHLINSEQLFHLEDIIVSLTFTLHNAGAAYVTLDWWVPRFYKQKQYLRFTLLTLLTIVIFSILLTASLFPIFANFDEWHPNFPDFLDRFINPIFWSNFSGIAALVIPYFVLQRMEMERKNDQLAKEKLATELQLLKSLSLIHI